MIEQVKSYKSKDGQIHATLEAAQTHEIKGILPDALDDVAASLVKQSDAVIAILKLKPRKAKAAKKAAKNTAVKAA
jgi:hypothetical protein